MSSSAPAEGARSRRRIVVVLIFILLAAAVASVVGGKGDGLPDIIWVGRGSLEGWEDYVIDPKSSVAEGWFVSSRSGDDAGRFILVERRVPKSIQTRVRKLFGLGGYSFVQFESVCYERVLESGQDGDVFEYRRLSEGELQGALTPEPGAPK